MIRGVLSDRIDGGALRGNNLFHSFLEFNVGEGRGVYFSNPTGIENILTRVTGSNASNILGRLGVLGNANLFLLNPNGILFGASASLDLVGSFTASTASAIKLGEQGLFSATEPQQSALLSVQPDALFLNALAQQRGNISNAGNLAVGAGQHLTLYGGTVSNTGTLAAAGGTVQVLGDRITLLPNSRIDVSSPTAGGTVLIGGDFQGRGGIPTASQVQVSPGVMINADAVDSGNGGRVIVWADGATQFDGTISARGGAQSGDGGFVEVSGRENLSVRGGVDVSAERGSAGTILFDPKNITIAPAGVTPVPPNDTFGENPTGSVTFNAATINALVGNVVLQASNDITVNQAIFTGPNTSLTLQAGRSIFINQNVSAGSNGQLTLLANASLADGVVNAQRDAGAAQIGMATGTALNAGRIVVSLGTGSGLTNNSAGDVRLENLNANRGTISLNAARNLTLTNANAGGIGVSVLTATAGGDVRVDRITANGLAGSQISLTAGGQLDAQRLVSGGGTIRLIATGPITADNLSTATITQGQGDILLQSQSNITAQNLVSAAPSGSGTIRLDAGGNINARRITSSPPALATSTGDILLTATGNITATDLATASSAVSGNIRLTSLAGNIDTSGGGLISRADFSSGEIVLSAAGDIRTGFLIANSTANRIPAGVPTTGDINITAGGAFSVDNSLISTDAVADNGRSGDIRINARSVSLTNGAQISTSVSRGAQGGTLTIQAPDFVVLEGAASLDRPPSGVFTEAGNALDLPVGQQQGGFVLPDAFSDLLENAGYPSGLFTQTSGGGDAGGMQITTGQLILRDRAAISGTTLGSGNAGRITVLPAGTDSSVSLVRTSIFSGSVPGSTGNGGEISIQTGSLNLDQGGTVQTQSLGQGNAGNIQVIASQSVTATGVGPVLNLPSGLLSSAEGEQSGEGGDITLSTGSLTLRQGAVLSARTNSLFRGGDITVNATTVEVSGSARMVATASSQGNAGTITVNASDRLRLSDSDTGLFASTTNTSSGTGGDITVSGGSLTIENGANITTRSDGQGNAGNIAIALSGDLRTSGGEISASSTQAGGGDISISADDIRLRNSSLLTTSVAQSTGGGGNITINANIFLALEDSDILANADAGPGGNISIISPVFLADLFSSGQATAVGQNPGNFSVFRGNNRVDISASSRVGISGSVSFPDFSFLQSALASLAGAFVNPDQVVAGSCLARRNAEQGSFTVTGTGGLARTPLDGRAAGRYVTREVRSLTEEKAEGRGQKAEGGSLLPTAPHHPIQEAQGMVFLLDGRVALAIAHPSAQPLTSQEILCESDD
jgi:filamentous hemagglutinin family protein